MSRLKASGNWKVDSSSALKRTPLFQYEELYVVKVLDLLLTTYSTVETVPF